MHISVFVADFCSTKVLENGKKNYIWKIGKIYDSASSDNVDGDDGDDGDDDDDDDDDDDECILSKSMPIHKIFSINKGHISSFFCFFCFFVFFSFKLYLFCYFFTISILELFLFHFYDKKNWLKKSLHFTKL